MSSKNTFKRRLLKFFIFFSPLIAYWSLQYVPVMISGSTMGTTYHVKAYIPRYMSTSSLKDKIYNRLQQINKSMSTWDKNSQISKFNQSKSIKPIIIDNDFFTVLTNAKYIYNITNGAWDGTIEPILKLWRFSQDNTNLKPDIKNKIKKNKIKKILPNIGFDKITLKKPNLLQKSNKNISLNLSSIAKGYGVDEIAKVLEANKITSYFVEIGGEVFAKNKKYDNSNWKIGIAKPNSNNLDNEIFDVIELNNNAIATSGDYRNYITLDNQKYSHIFDPKTAYPIKNNIASVSVIANTTILADGLATAFMVMGVKKSILLANKLDNIDVFIITRNKNNSFSTFSSKNFPKPIKKKI
jgi:thiamine biosynthesis lipoprotein